MTDRGATRPYPTAGGFLYKEGASSTYTHNGHTGTVDSLIEQAKDKAITYMKVNKLKWILQHADLSDPADDVRINQADLSIPIIVCFSIKYGKHVVLDGAHRLAKAVKLGYVEIPAHIIDDPSETKPVSAKWSRVSK